MDLELLHKVAIVTGSSRGLGLASARALASEGCRVTLTARGVDALDRAAAELGAAAGRDRVLAVAADVSTEAGAADVVRRTVERFGRLDILVNNVGKAGGGDIVSTSDADWQSALDQTLFPAIRVSRLAVPHMRAAAGGVILMIASIWGRESGGRMTYNAVKAAEISLAKAMAQQQHRARVDFFRRRDVVETPAGRSRGHGRLRQAGHSPRPLRPRGGSRKRRGVSRLTTRQLDYWCVCDCRWWTEQSEHLTSQKSEGRS